MGTGKKYIKNTMIWPRTLEARLYQQTIAEKAYQKNTMVILPTALGKTAISALVATHFLSNHWNMKILVMAPTRPLVLQHKNTFSQCLRLKIEDIVVLTGKVPPSYRKNLWKGNAKVYFATPQVVKNDLSLRNLSLKNFSFLVFDECHRARKNYAYTFVAKKYIEQAPWPIIMATTASPGSDKNNIYQTCRDLFIEQVEFRTEEDPDVVPYIHQVNVEWKLVELPEEYKETSQILRKILWERLGKLRSMGMIQKSSRYVTRRDLLKAGEDLRERLEESPNSMKGPIYGAIVIQAASLTLFHALTLLETQGAFTLYRFLERVENNAHRKKSYRNIVSDPQYLLMKAKLAKISGSKYPKALSLNVEIQRHLRSKISTRILVFTQYRDTATYLVKELENLSGAYVKRFVGQATKEGDPGLSQEEQVKILHDFKEGKLNILVATSIAEEGLDIPDVDLVIFYEPIPSEIRYIQRKGRTGRKNIGKTVILAAKETYDIAYLYASKRRVEKMKNIVKSLNKQLGSIARRGEKPIQEHFPESEIIKRKKSVFTEAAKKSEMEKARESAKVVSRAARSLWKKVKKAGVKGVSKGDLIQELASEGYSLNIVEAAINYLENADQIRKLSLNRIVAIDEISTVPKKGSKIYEIEIERVLQGKAICVVDRKWKARLLPGEYEGPINLIRRNTKFKARGELYHEGKSLCIQVHSVTEIL